MPSERYSSGSDELCERTVADFTAVGLLGGAMRDIMRLKYRKLLGNLGNAIEALFGASPSGHAVAEIQRRIADGAIACMEAAGLDPISTDDYQETRGS